MTWFKNNFWIFWAAAFGGFDLFATIYLLVTTNNTKLTLFYFICFLITVPTSLMAHYTGKKSRKQKREDENFVINKKLEFLKERFFRMTWKDVVIFSILILGFIIIILSIILNDKTPMDIFQSIYIIVLLCIVPAQRIFYWLKKVSNRKKQYD